MAHHNTVFAQLLGLVPRHEFEAVAREHRHGQGLRAMSRWPQFVALGLAQLTGRQSLRDVVNNLSAQGSKLYHLGVKDGQSVVAGAGECRAAVHPSTNGCSDAC